MAQEMALIFGVGLVWSLLTAGFLILTELPQMEDWNLQAGLLIYQAIQL